MPFKIINYLYWNLSSFNDRSPTHQTALPARIPATVPIEPIPLITFDIKPLLQTQLALSLAAATALLEASLTREPLAPFAFLSHVYLQNIFLVIIIIIEIHLFFLSRVFLRHFDIRCGFRVDGIGIQ